jgi:DNA-binding response OmpR family regulator
VRLGFAPGSKRKSEEESSQMGQGQEATHSIPIILLCARKDTRQMAMDAGADAFLAKPFEMGGLLALVATFLGMSSSCLSA